MSKIYISLIKTQSPIGKIASYIKNDDVTHAAIALDKDLYTLCGFGRKSNWNPIIAGFREETYQEGYYSRLKTLPGMVLEVEITDEQYVKVMQIVEHFDNNRDLYHYSFVKLLSNLINKKVEKKNGFICSEFVAFVLQKADILEFSTPLNLVRPQVLMQELLKYKSTPVYKGDMKLYASPVQISDKPEIRRWQIKPLLKQCVRMAIQYTRAL